MLKIQKDFCKLKFVALNRLFIVVDFYRSILAFLEKYLKPPKNIG